MLGIGIGALLVGAGGTYFFTKGGSGSHNEAKVEAQGAINNVVVTDFQDHVEIKNKEIMILLYIICLIKLVEFLLFIYNRHVNGIRKKYGERQNRDAPNPA